MKAIRPWMIVAGLAVTATVLGGSAYLFYNDPATREAKYLRRGDSYFESKDFSRARIEYRNAGRINPADANVVYHLGLVEEATGNLRDAFGLFSRAETQNANFAPALLKIAKYLITGGQYDDAQRRLTAVLNQEPENPEAHALVGAIALRRDDIATAEKEARFAHDRAPANLSAISVLTGAQMAAGNVAAAEKTLADALVLMPKDDTLFRLRVALYQKAKDTAKTEAAYRALTGLLPRDSGLRNEIANFYLDAHRPADAEAALRQATADIPDDWALKQRLVDVLDQEKGQDAAEKEIRQLMAENPDHTELYFWLAQLFINHDAVDKAITLLQEVANRSQFTPDGLNAQTYLARISFSRGDRALTEKLISAVLAKAPGNHEALMLRAGLEFDDGQYQSVVSDLRALLREHTNSPDALRMLAETLLRQGHVELAADTLAQIVSLTPTDTGVRVRLAQMYHLQGDNRRALATLAEVTRAKPDEAVAWEAMARMGVDNRDLAVAEDGVAHLEKLPDQTLTATFLRGQMLVLQNRPDDGIAQFAKVITTDGAAPIADYALAALVNTYRATNRVEAAAHFIEGLKSANPFAQTLLAECDLALNRPDAATSLLDTVLATNPQRPEPYLDRAALAITRRQNDQAIKVLEAARRALPGDPRPARMLSDFYIALARYDDAERVFDDLLQRNPASDDAANDLAEMIADFKYADLTALEKARRLAERFQGSSDLGRTDTLAWVYYRLGQNDQAILLVQKSLDATEAIPPQAHYHNGAILLKANRTEDARAELNKAVATKDRYPGLDDAKHLLATL